jgi:hypothetical protein
MVNNGKEGHQTVKVFRMIRQKDISGVSGTGHVLDGIIFDDGTTVVTWRSNHASISIFRSYEDFKAIHITPHPENNTVEEIKEIAW